MKRSAGAGSRQRGQALIFVAITTVMVLLGVLIFYNVAQLTTQKMKLQNTVDAAVYSGAMVVARDYNFSAYSNRAMIANQVAIAQMVGLASWARNIDNVFHGSFAAIPEVFANTSALAAMWDVPWGVGEGASGPLKTGVEVAAKVLILLDDGINEALSAGQFAYHTLGVADNFIETIIEVVHANDPDAEISTGLAQVAYAAQFFSAFKSFTGQGNLSFSQFDPKSTSGAAADDRFANVVFNSEDDFYLNRTSPIWITPSLIDPTKFVVPYNYGTSIMFLAHSGGTEWKENVNGEKYQTVTGLDATGLFALLVIWNPFPPFPIPIPILLPQGYGAAMCGTGSGGSLLQPASNNLNHDFTAAYGNTFVNPLTMAAGWMSVGQGPGAKLGPCGLKKYYDVKDHATGTTAYLGPPVALEIYKPIAKIRQSNSPAPGLNVADGDTDADLYLEDGTESSKIKAISKAQVYFSRPKSLFGRGDKKTEYGSLYSPYWQVSLTSNTLLEQVVSILGQSL